MKIGIGNKIKYLRLNKTENKISQTKFAIELNTTQDTVSLWELEKSYPDILSIINIAKYFNVSADYLLGLEDEYGNKLYDQPYNIKPKPIPTTLTANTAIPNTQTAIFMQHGGKPFTLELTQEDEAKILKLLDIKKKPL